MKDAKGLGFTPGPWMTGKPQRVGKILMHRDMHVGNFETKRFVASCEFWDTPGCDEENRANARLVAAAPDLYEAVRRWEEMWSRYSFPPGGSWPMLREEHLSILESAREALAKAGWGGHSVNADKVSILTQPEGRDARRREASRKGRDANGGNG